MPKTNMTALVVDDEPLVRNLTIRALRLEGYKCDSAVDGNEALTLASRENYGVVITDIKMPNKHGHALAVELLQMPKRPLIIVMTGLLEPKIANDLKARGVDEIMFKPVNYQELAKRVTELTFQRLAQSISKDELGTGVPGAGGADAAGEPVPSAPPESIDAQAMSASLSRAVQEIEVSEPALDAYRMIQSGSFNTKDMAESIAKDAELSKEVVQIANCPFFNPKRVDFSDLDRAIMQVGLQRVSQLALTCAARASLVADEESPLDVELTWQRSIAAGLAVEMLVKAGDHFDIAEGLVLCASLQNIGRVALAKLYRDQYKSMIALCKAQRKSLAELEADFLPDPQSHAITELLGGWGISDTPFRPLHHVHLSYGEIAKLDKPLRTKVLLVRLAGLVADLAIGRWNAWDAVEIPDDSIISELNIESLPTVIGDTRLNTECINKMAKGKGLQDDKAESKAPTPLKYFEAATCEFDALHAIIASMNIDLRKCIDPSGTEDKLLMNCLGVKNDDAKKALGNPGDAQVSLVCSKEDAEFYGASDKGLCLPASYAAINAVLPGLA